ncbi:MAG: metallophosphoesterase [Actinomycetia bacterium]|nr:metallophosphoesterase [Actinomycetes bacterium]
MALAPAAEAAAPFDPHLTRAPYLTDLVGLHVLVNWATDRTGTTGSLAWGAVSGSTCNLTNTQTATRISITVGPVLEYQWKASLTLPSQGTYCYRALLGATDLLATNPSPQFRTQAAAGDSSPFSFAVFGDWGQVDANGDSADQTNLFAQVAASGSRFAVSVGDNGYPSGSQTNYGDLQQRGANTSAIFGPTFWTVPGSSIPLFSAVGNHGLSGTSHTDITTWTQDAAVATSGGRYQNDVYCCVNGSSSSNYGSEWYAFDAGPARFYILDSAWGDTNGGTASPYANDAAAHFTPGTPEYQWLLGDLQAHPTGLKFAFSHYPWYSDSNSQVSDTFLQGPSQLEGLLAQYDAKIAFQGHAHIYERNTPSAPGMPVTYVTGGGGATIAPIGPCHAYDAYGIGWSPTKLKGTKCGAAPVPTSGASVFHFLKVTVAGSTVTVAPTEELGRTFDVQTYNFPTKPDTLIDTKPTSPTNATTATFTFHATGSGATFACSLDGAAPSACTSPTSYPALASGSHSFTVAATNSAGSDATPAAASWTIDTTPPSVPTNPAANATSPTAVDVSWTASTDTSGVARYDVARGGVTIGSATAPATTFTDTTASPGTTYSYTVSAVDAAGNPSAFSAPASATTPALGSMPSLVQSAGSSSLTVTLPAPSTPGDLLVLSASLYTGLSKQITAVTDGTNTWKKVGAFAVSGANSDGEMWYASNAGSVSSVTITTTAPAVALSLQEFAGVAATAPLDGSTGSANTGTAASSGAVTPTAANDLAVGFVAGHANAQTIGNLPAGYSTQAQQNTTSPNTSTVVTGYQALKSANAQSFGGSFPAAMYWSAGVALFKATSGPDFSIAASPSAVTVTAGQAATSTISTTVTSGAAQNMTLSASGLPSGVTASFAPASISSGQNSTLTLTTSGATPAGTSTITVTGTGAVATHSTSVSLTVAPVATGPALVQATGATEAAAATSLAGTFAAPTTTGNLLVLSASVYTGATNHITSVTDTGGNTWTRIATFSVSGHNSDGEMWYSPNAASATTVTVHTATAVSIALAVQEFSGVAATSPLDVSAGSANTSNTPSSGPLTPTAASVLVVGFVTGHANAQTITVTSPGYTVQPQQTSTGSIASVITGFKVLSAASSQTFDASYTTAMYWAAGIAAFKAAP